MRDKSVSGSFLEKRGSHFPIYPVSTYGIPKLTPGPFPASICYNAMTESDEDQTSESPRIPEQSRLPMGLIERLVQE
jgi:hypothetical protein